MEANVSYDSIKLSQLEKHDLLLLLRQVQTLPLTLISYIMPSCLSTPIFQFIKQCTLLDLIRQASLRLQEQSNIFSPNLPQVVPFILPAHS